MIIWLARSPRAKVCSLKDYLFHVRLKTWEGFFWMVNTERMIM